MKITFLGTGAAEGIPAVWCECELCKQAKMLGGKDIRRRCTYAVDDDTMIDFGPDAVRQTQDAGIDLTRLERIIFTHNHPDHLSPMELQFRRTGYFSRVSRELTVIGSCRIFSRILSFTAEDCGIYTLADLRHSGPGKGVSNLMCSRAQTISDEPADDPGGSEHRMEQASVRQQA